MSITKSLNLCVVLSGKNLANSARIIADKINEAGYGFRLVRSGAGWSTEWVWEDRQSGLCTPAHEDEIRAKADELGIE